MVKRLITGICLVAVVTAFFLLRKINAALFEPLIMLFVTVGTFEMLRATGGKLTALQKLCVIVYSLLFVPVFHLFLYKGILSLYFGLGLAILGALVIDKKSDVENTALSLFCAFYPSMLLSTMLMANRLQHNSLIALLFIFIIPSCTDTFAYVVGCTLKGRKLCPAISPNKTVSGAIGGLAGGVAGGLVLYLIFRRSLIYSGLLPGIVLFMLIGFAAAAFTEFGDLVESVIKRKSGVKDMGRLLPGHGGIMDRIDGVIFASCFVFACFYLLI